MKRMLLAVCFAAAAAAVAVADCPDIYLWRTPYRVAPDASEETAALTKRLSLDAAVQARVRERLEASQRKLDVLATQRDDESRALFKLSNELRAHSDRLNELRREIAAERAQDRAAVRAMIPAERQRAFDDMEAARDHLEAEAATKECEEAGRLKDRLRPDERADRTAR